MGKFLTNLSLIENGGLILFTDVSWVSNIEVGGSSYAIMDFAWTFIVACCCHIVAASSLEAELGTLILGLRWATDMNFNNHFAFIDCADVMQVLS